MGGNSQSILYAQPINEKPQGQTSIYRYPQFKNQLVDQPFEGGKTLKDIMIHTKQLFGNRQALGAIKRTELSSNIEWITYNQFFNQAHALGSAIINEELLNIDTENNMNFIGIFAKNRIEWSVVDIAGILYRIVTVPIYDTLGDENISYVLRHVSMKTVFVENNSIKSLKKTHDLDKLQWIVSFDPLDQENIDYFAGKGIKLISYSDLLAKGQQKLVDYMDPKFKVLPQDCTTFSYTSGTTGPPKGAMMSHKNFASFCGGAQKNKDFKINCNDIILSYLPLPHILERQFLYIVFCAGGSVVYYSGDIAKIKDDLAMVKPTIFASVPRLFTRFYDVMQSKFKQVQGYTKTALDYAINSKLQTVKTTGVFTHPVYDRIFFNKTKMALGGRCRFMLCGGAPLLPQVHNFMKIAMCCPLVEGYGQTQNTGAGVVTDAYDPQTTHVGGPLAHFQLKLVDIPEMEYLSTDTDNEGRSTPKGEIWIRGGGVFLGYYKDAQKTKETLTQDGWLKTGDVGQLLPNTKGLKIIDRKKNIFKLQHGQYVAAQKVEHIYAKNDFVEQIFLHGDSTETFCVAIVVPNHKHLEKLAKDNNVEGSFEQLAQKKTIRLQILKKINQTGKQNGLKGFQQAKNIYIETIPFMNRGILTNTMKIQRHQAKKTYKDVIAKLYDEKQLK